MYYDFGVICWLQPIRLHKLGLVKGHGSLSYKQKALNIFPFVKSFAVPLPLKLDNNKILTHWGRVRHICVVDLTIIGSDNGLSPGRRQAIIWTNAGILLIGPLGTNLSEILIEIQTFSLKKIRLKMSSAKWRPFCLGLNVLTKSSNSKVIIGFPRISVNGQFWGQPRTKILSPYCYWCKTTDLLVES